MNEDTSTINYTPWDGKTVVMPDGRIIRFKKRSPGWSTFISTWMHTGVPPAIPFTPFPFQEQQMQKALKQTKFMQAVQDIVHRWWSSMEIEKYESERIERMNRWAGR